MVLKIARGGGNANIAELIQVPFSGAVTNTQVWVGPGRVMQVVITAGAVGTIDMVDTLTPGFGPAIGPQLITSAALNTFLVNGGLGIEIFAGILLTIVGANTGYIVVREQL